MSDLHMDVDLGSSVEEALQAAFATVMRSPNTRVILEYGTMCSSGKFFVTSESNYAKHIAAFKRAQNHTDEFEKTYDKGVIIGP